MGLNQAQKELLEVCQISKTRQASIEKSTEKGLDFLDSLSDELQSAETLLLHNRIKLKEAQDIKSNCLQPQSLEAIASSGVQDSAAIEHLQTVVLLRAEAYVNKLEEELKTNWHEATSLWQSVDYLVRHPENYGITLSPKIVHRLFAKKNLTVIEMIKWAKPEFFTLSPSPVMQYLSGTLCAIFGLILGMVGGIIGGVKLAENPDQTTKTVSVIDAIKSWGSALIGGFMGFFSGAATGSTAATEVGFKTGDIWTGATVGYAAALLNPFHRPPGFKEHQAVKLIMEQTLFEYAARKT